MSADQKIEELRRTTIACTEAILNAIAIAVEPKAMGNQTALGGPAWRIRELARGVSALS